MVQRLSPKKEEMFFTLIIATKEGLSFDEEELANLCAVPELLSLTSINEIDKVAMIPTLTPSVMLVADGHIVAQIPVLVSTEMETYLLEFEILMDNLAAYAGP